MRCMRLPHRIWAPPRSKFYGVGAYSITEFGRAEFGCYLGNVDQGSIFHAVHIL